MKTFADRSVMESWSPLLAVAGVAFTAWVLSRPRLRERLARAAGVMLGPSDSLRWAAIPVAARPLLPLEPVAVEAVDRDVEGLMCLVCRWQRCARGGWACGSCAAAFDEALEQLTGPGGVS